MTEADIRDTWRHLRSPGRWPVTARALQREGYVHVVRRGPLPSVAVRYSDVPEVVPSNFIDFTLTNDVEMVLPVDAVRAPRRTFKVTGRAGALRIVVEEGFY